MRNTMERPEGNNHACFFYDTLDEYLTFTASFIAEGLQSDELVLCVADGTRHDRLLDAVGETMNVVHYLLRNQLHLYPPEVCYLAGGEFKPERILGQLQQATTNFAAQGCSGVRVCGDMTWALQLGELTTLIDYEAAVNAVLPTHCVAVCQYDRRQFPRDVLLDIFMLHHYIKHDDHLIVNPAYQTASNLLLALR
jgi:hypothetical protein